MASRKHYHSPKGIAAAERGKAYKETPKGKAWLRAYKESGRRNRVTSAWQKTDGAKKKKIIAACKWKQSDKGKASIVAEMARVSAKSRSRPNGHDLYIMKCDYFPDHYKVGRAADPHWRARGVESGWFFAVEVVQVYDGFGKHEKLVHAELAPFEIQRFGRTGNRSRTEWFRLPYGELVEKINSVISQFEH